MLQNSQPAHFHDVTVGMCHTGYMLHDVIHVMASRILVPTKLSDAHTEGCVTSLKYSVHATVVLIEKYTFSLVFTGPGK